MSSRIPVGCNSGGSQHHTTATLHDIHTCRHPMSLLRDPDIHQLTPSGWIYIMYSTTILGQSIRPTVHKTMTWFTWQMTFSNRWHFQLHLHFLQRGGDKLLPEPMVTFIDTSHQASLRILPGQRIATYSCKWGYSEYFLFEFNRLQTKK